MALISEYRNQFGDRDFARWRGLLDYLSQAERQIKVARMALAAELGFDSRKPGNVKIGDRVRLGSGTWATVTEMAFTEHEDGPTEVTLYFGEHVAQPLTVKLASDYDPTPPARLIVEVPEQDPGF